MKLIKFQILSILHLSLMLRIRDPIHMDKAMWLDRCRRDYRCCPTCFDNPMVECRKQFRKKIEISPCLANALNSLSNQRTQQYGILRQTATKTQPPIVPIVLKYYFDHERWEAFTMNIYSLNPLGVDMQELLGKMRDYFLEGNGYIAPDGSEINDSFQLFPRTAVDRLLELSPISNVMLKWAMMLMQPEPLIFSVLHKYGFPVPEIKMECGFVAAVSWNGNRMRDFMREDPRTRLRIAQQVIEAAVKFSHGVKGLR